MKRFTVAVSVMAVLLSLFASPLNAQETACTTENVNAAITALLNAATAAAEEADPKAAVDLLSPVSTRVFALQAICNGFSFEGQTASVLGPIEFPEGVYRAVVNTNGFFIANLSVLDGQCQQGTGMFGSPLLFSAFQGQAVNAEAIFSSSGCTTLIEISNIQSPWTLRFEKLT